MDPIESVQDTLGMRSVLQYAVQIRREERIAPGSQGTQATRPGVFPFQFTVSGTHKNQRAIRSTAVPEPHQMGQVVVGHQIVGQDGDRA